MFDLLRDGGVNARNEWDFTVAYLESHSDERYQLDSRDLPRLPHLTRRTGLGGDD
jgi:hypothetical protein